MNNSSLVVDNKDQVQTENRWKGLIKLLRASLLDLKEEV